MKDKRVILEEFPQRNRGIMQAFVFNTRRDKFKDARLRRAFNLAYDFEEMNKQMFFGQYKRINSYFEGTELASSGLPQGQELEILETVRDKVPPEVFTTAYSNPVGGEPGESARQSARGDCGCCKEAGYEVRNQKLVNAKTGETMSVEILADADPAVERFILFYKPSLERLGINCHGPHRRRYAIRKPDAQLGFRHDHRVLAAIAVARQRAARLLEHAGGRHARARATSSASRTRRSMR